MPSAFSGSAHIGQSLVSVDLFSISIRRKFRLVLAEQGRHLVPLRVASLQLAHATIRAVHTSRGDSAQTRFIPSQHRRQLFAILKKCAPRSLVRLEPYMGEEPARE